MLPDTASSMHRAVLFANSAAARLKLEQFAEAAKDCSACLALEPHTKLEIKALTRRSIAYEKLDDLDRALADYEKVQTLPIPRPYQIHTSSRLRMRSCHTEYLISRL